MINTLDLSTEKLLDIMDHQEIMQEDNDNAHSRLFVMDGNVYKLFDMTDQRSADDLQNLSHILEFSHSFGDRIVVPDSLIRYNSRIVGYRQPYINGYPLRNYMEKRVSPLIINHLFIDLGQTIRMTGSNVHVGDLHGGNIMVREDLDTYIVDADGFAIEGTTCRSHPLEGKPGTPDWLYQDNCQIISSYMSDYAATLNLYGSYLLNGMILFCMSARVYNAYAEYLSNFDSCRGFSEAMKCFIDKKQTMDWNSIATVDEDDLINASYDNFRENNCYKNTMEDETWKI